MAEYYVDSNKEVTLLAGATDNHYNANISFDNINDTAKNIANWSNNITNCITYIPQDIKLELNNGTLILKAGSKVYVPNGFEADGVTPKFDAVIVNSDKSITNSSNNTFFTFYDYDAKAFGNLRTLEHIYSGTTQPSDTSNHIWYDTSTNKIKLFSNGAYLNHLISFSVCICIASGTITSIDQIFNGFGYIGSTVFALPGVKGLIPNYRNTDGSLKNVPFTVQNVMTFTGDATGTVDYTINENNIAYIYHNEYKYNNTDNLNYNANNVPLYCVSMGIANISSGKINFIQQPQVFHALDYNDTSYISTQSCPSNKYRDLSLLASGSTYTAPANGYFNLIINTPNGYIYMNVVDDNGVFLYSSTESNGTSVTGSRVFHRVKKGQKVLIAYSGTVGYFRFIYDEGEIN